MNATLPWWRGRLCAFDLETTGTNVFGDYIVTASVAYVGDGRPVQTLNWLVDPGVPIPAEAAAVHGITTERAVAEGDGPQWALPEIALALCIAIGEGWPIVAFNAPFDLSLLVSELRRRELESELEVRLAGASIVDPLVIDRGLDKYRKGSRKLADTCKHYGVSLDNAHDSNADALAAARLAFKLAMNNPAELGDLVALQKRQADWYRTWAVSLASHLRSQGKPVDDLDPAGWPLRRQPLEAPCG